MNRRGVLNITNPIKNGLIINWEDMEKLWHHCFYSEMKVSPEGNLYYFKNLRTSLFIH